MPQPLSLDDRPDQPGQRDQVLARTRHEVEPVVEVGPLHTPGGDALPPPVVVDEAVLDRSRTGPEPLQERNRVAHDSRDGLLLQSIDRVSMARPNTVQRQMRGDRQLDPRLRELDHDVPLLGLPQGALLREGTSLPPVELEHPPAEVAPGERCRRLAPSPGALQRRVEQREQQGVLVGRGEGARVEQPEQLLSERDAVSAHDRPSRRWWPSTQPCSTARELGRTAHPPGPGPRRVAAPVCVVRVVRSPPRSHVRRPRSAPLKASRVRS
jgi:hypothetical protein